ncbi:Alpha-(1,3)-fucosyltransferase C, partial [Lamellibrachia satsuma]
MTRHHRTYRMMSQSWVIGLLKVVRRRELRIACLFTVVILCLQLLHVKLSPQVAGGVDCIDGYSSGDIDKAKRGQPSSLLMIYWTTVFLKKDWGFGADLEHCRHLKDKCIFSTDRSLYRTADVMLLHMRDTFEIPKYRPPHQKWAFGIMESPVYTGLDLVQIRRLFNVTMTYKRTSNIPWLYGRCRPLSNSEITVKLAAYRRINFAAGKKHVAAWFTSNCNAQSKRQVYVTNLMKYLDIHVYGICGGTYSCPKGDATRCLEIVNKDYKFMFAFENSLCEDYVTEKVWQIMQMQLNVILVVMGNSKYQELLPPHSFIDVSDFPSPKALAEHLTRLDGDDALYNEYFQWRTTHDCTSNGAPMGCQVCDYMLRHRNETQTVDVQQFWSVETNCVQPDQFFAGWEKMDNANVRTVCEE